MHVGHELIAAGMLILAAGGSGKALDYSELERWTRVGYERGVGSAEMITVDSPPPKDLLRSRSRRSMALRCADAAQRRSQRHHCWRSFLTLHMI
jgi:hypothetical protein